MKRIDECEVIRYSLFVVSEVYKFFNVDLQSPSETAICISIPQSTKVPAYSDIRIIKFLNFPRERPKLSESPVLSVLCCKMLKI